MRYQRVDAAGGIYSFTVNPNPAEQNGMSMESNRRRPTRQRKA